VNKLSSQDRSALIRLASSLPVGSTERKAILAGLSGTDKTSASGGGTAEKHQLKVLTDTVKNPMKGKFLGGPSAEEAEKTLREKFHFTDKQIASLKKANFNDTGKTSVVGEMKKISPPVEAEPSPELVARAHVAAQSPGYAITNPLRFGLMPLAFMYGQILEQPRQMVVLSGESLRVIKTKKIVVLVGVDERGQPILARNEAELKAKTKALNQSRLHHESAR